VQTNSRGARASLAVGAATIVCAAAIVAFKSIAAPQSPRPVLIFAAASLQTVLDELAPDVGRETGHQVRTSYAATSALARQIENGAPADLFISADEEWLDYLAARGGIRPETRVNLARNELVLVAPRGRPGRLRIAPGFPLMQALGTGRLALADPDSVPAGRYAKAALMRLDVWPTVSERLAPADNVRAALVLVARGESPLGVVYRTDAIVDPRVAIVDVFPASTHPPIVYPAALTSSASPAAGSVLDYLRSSQAKAHFAEHGFQIDP
jgi:molybdate transport system substrate-binding protein